jgi:hypothetical protein
VQTLLSRGVLPGGGEKGGRGVSGMRGDVKTDEAVVQLVSREVY